MTRLAIAIALALATSCSRTADRAPGTAPDLATYLFGLAGRDEPARAAVVATWRLDRAAWERLVVPPYHGLYDDYTRAFDAAAPTLVAQLARSRSIVSRAHFAGDPAATRAQAVVRWALPTLAASKLAELAGRPPEPLDAVFVDDRGAWRAIVGVDAILRARIAGLDPACATVIDVVEPAGGPCIEAAWGVADAALRSGSGDRTRFAHACSLAMNLCGTRFP